MRGLLALLLCAAAIALAQEPRSLQPVGVFSAIRNTNDHTYGQQVRLWRSGSRLVGEILYWDGNLEAQRGRFEDGEINSRTGVVRFNAVIVRADVQPNTRAEAAFEGVLAKSMLTGKLTWLAGTAKTRGKNGVESTALRFDASDKLEPFATIEAWRKALP